MRRTSIKLRLGLGIVVMLAITVLVLTISAYEEFNEALFDLLDNSLTSQAQAVTSAIDPTETLPEIDAEIRSIFGKISGTKSPIYRVWFEGDQNEFIGGL